MDASKRSLTTAFLIEGSLILFLNVTIYGDLPLEDRHIVLWSILLGIAIFLCGLRFVKGETFYAWTNDKLERAGAWFGTSPWQVLLLLTSPVFAFLAINASGFWIRMRSPAIAVAAWFIAIALALAGGWKRGEARPRLSTATLIWFAMLTLLAFLFRAVATEQIPILLTGDEASAGASSTRYATGEWNNLFITSWFSFPALFTFIQSISIRMLGNTVEAVRLPSALAGALTVGVVYLCGKSMFGQRAGIFAALILAALHFHIHFSRLGLNNIWDGLWFTLTVGALWFGWKAQARWAYLLAGLSLGLSQYFYASSKALIGVVVAAALLALLFRRARFRLALPDVCVLLIVALAVFIPLGWYYVNEPNALLAPLTRVSMVKEIVSSSTALRNFVFQQLPISLEAYTHTQFTRLSFWYPSETPLLRPIAATFFCIGLLFLLFQSKDSRGVLLVLWLTAIALLNALSSIIPVAQRYVAAAPACALIAGYGLHNIAEILAGLWPRLQKTISAVAWVLVVTIMASDLLFYFGEFTAFARLDEITSNGMIAHQFGHYLKGQPEGTQVVFFGVPRLAFDSPAILYLAPQIMGLNAPEEWETFDPSQLTAPKTIFVFLPEYRDDIQLVQADFPGGILTTEKAWNGDILYWVYERNR